MTKKELRNNLAEEHARVLELQSELHYSKKSAKLNKELYLSAKDTLEMYEKENAKLFDSLTKYVSFAESIKTLIEALEEPSTTAQSFSEFMADVIAKALESDDVSIQLF